MKARRTIHRGHQFVDALLLERDAEARALALFGPGVRVSQVEGGLVVYFSTPRLLRVDSCVGLPLVRSGDALCSAPLEADERSGRAGIVVVRHGRVVSLGEGTPVDPSHWLHLDVRVVEVSSLGHPPPPPPAAPQAAAGTRAVFADLVGEQAQEVNVLLEALGKGAAATGAFSTAAMSWMGALRGLLQPKDGAAEGTGPNWMGELDSWLAEKMAGMGLGSLVGQAHSRFLEQLMADFERGALDEALRRAIPLGGGGLGGALAGLRAPGPRDSLGFTRGGSSSVIPMAEALMERLRELYKNALRQLENAGRIDEAAFVLAELLNQPKEAVALLEKHGRFARAAELAEVKELDADLVVRLWFLAGKVDRAILTARRRGGMDAALKRLKDRDPKLERRLRILWAASLASTGRYGAAVRLLKDTPGAERVVDRWLDAAIEAGGPDGAEALCLALQRRQDWQPLYAIGQQWLQGSYPQVMNLSAALETSRAAEPLLRLGARQLTARRATHGAQPKLDDLLARVRKSAGGAVSVDLPRDVVPVTPLLRDRPQPLTLRFDAAGAAAPAEVRWLPRDRLLIARGEGGLELWAGDGRLLRRWEQPAHELAVHDDGTEAIALADRGRLKRLARVDLTSMAAAHWAEASITHFSRTYADPWVVAGDHEILAIDVAAAGWRRTWRVGTDSPVLGLARSDQGVFYLADNEGWHRRLPDLSLIRRDTDQRPNLLGLAQPLLGGLFQTHQVYVVQHDDGYRLVGINQAPAFEQRPVDLAMHGSVLAIALHGQVCVFFNKAQSSLVLDLPGGSPRLFLDAHRLVVWDDMGRVVVVDLALGEVLADLRL